MSKTKLAILVFCIAFGVNIGAFVFSKKAFTVEELKNVWIFELPPSASPLDSYGAIDLGPQQGIIGTIFKPNFRNDAPVETLLADTWTWSEKNSELTIRLKGALTYSDQSPIEAQHFVETALFLAPQVPTTSPEWLALSKARWKAIDPKSFVIALSPLPKDFDLALFLREVMTHSLSGVVHPKNLQSLKDNQKVTRDWISSGPYRVRKWNPKEITLVSRDDFPVMLPKEFFRTLKYQSAPVRNPSCHFVQAVPGEEKPMGEHSISPTEQSLHVFWICRSWAEKGSFCSNPENRASFAKLLSGAEIGSSQSLAGTKVRYRIPTGSDPFRGRIREQIESGVKLMGGSVEEISYFFKPSTDADIELLFVETPKGPNESKTAAAFAMLSSRLGASARSEKNLVGEIATHPVNILLKAMQGEVFDRVFLVPDLDQKLPL
jgi:hypothetical protein